MLLHIFICLCIYSIAEKDDSGAYILYSEKEGLNLKVIEVDNQGKKIKTYDL